ALGLEIPSDRLDATLPADTGVLPAAEGHHVADRAIGIDPDRAGLDRLGDAHRPADVLGPDPGREAVDGVVRNPYRLCLVFEPDDREDGTEDLLARDPHPGR